MRQHNYTTPASPAGMARLLDDFATDGAATCPRCGARMPDEARCGECGRHSEGEVAPAALWQALVTNDLATITRALVPRGGQ